MDQFLLHALILAWISLATAWRMVPRTTDRFLSAVLLAWANLVATGLILGAVRKLNDANWFVGCSLLLAAGICGLLRKLPRLTGIKSATDNNEAPHNWLQLSFGITLAPFALANLAAAFFYAPNNPDALSFQLPRTIFYLGQAHLNHFEAVDSRQVLLPFNYNLAQLLPAIYDAPSLCLNFFNLLAWCVVGVATYRLGQMAGAGPNAALIASWLALVAPPVIAQAATTTPELATCAALLSAAVFVVQRERGKDAYTGWLAGIGFGLAAGTSLHALVSIVGAGVVFLLTSYWRRPLESKAWIGPAILASALVLPVFLINFFAGFLRSPESWRGLGIIPNLETYPSAAPLLLTEDTVRFGISGIACLSCAAFCTTPYSGKTKVTNWCAWLVFGWIGVSLLLLRNEAALRPRELLTAALLAVPCIAITIRRAWLLSSFAVTFSVGLLVVFSGLDAAQYLLDNTRRPVRPIAANTVIPTALPPVPHLLSIQLTAQPWVNFDTDGTAEHIFPLMMLKQRQRFTALPSPQPHAYTLFSRASHTRDAGFITLTKTPVYKILAFPGKRTAGVQYVTKFTRGPIDRDYFGLIAEPQKTGADSSNSFLLISITGVPDDTEGKFARLSVAGLNPEDYACVRVNTSTNNGHDESFLTLDKDGTVLVPLNHATTQIVLKVIGTNYDHVFASAIIPVDTVNKAPSSPPLNPTSIDPNLLFSTDLVLEDDSRVVASNGLQVTEGPFPQRHIPYIRWAKEPSVQLVIAAVPELAKARLTLTVRLQVRETADMQILLNKKVLKKYRLDGINTWHELALDLELRPGINTVELRDLSSVDEPDWLDYLDSNPDVKNFVIAHNISPEQGASDHYKHAGEAEGRPLRTRTVSPPEDSSYFMFKSIRLEGFKAP